VSPDFVGYDAAEPEPIRGPAGVKANVEKYLTGFSNARVTVDDQVVEGNKVATRWTGKGTHDGEIAGVAPTGKEVTITGLTISTVENGKLVEDRTVWDTLGMLVQLGAVPVPTSA
jgi:predicted ester cyclase